MFYDDFPDRLIVRAQYFRGIVYLVKKYDFHCKVGVYRMLQKFGFASTNYLLYRSVWQESKKIGHKPTRLFGYSHNLKIGAHEVFPRGTFGKKLRIVAKF